MSGDSAKNTSNPRQRPVSDYRELEEKYGASRVRLTKSATDSFIKMSDAMIQILEYGLSQEGKEAGERSMKITMNGDPDPLADVTGLTLS